MCKGLICCTVIIFICFTILNVLFFKFGIALSFLESLLFIVIIPIIQIVYIIFILYIFKNKK